MKSYTFTISGNTYKVDIKSIEENVAEIEVNGTLYEVELGKEIQTPKTPKLVRYTPPKTKSPEPLTTNGLSLIKAPLPGTIVAVHVQPGSTVKSDQPLLILEAMKMENNIYAEKEGIVKNVKVAAGDTVMQGDILIEME